MKFSMLQRSIWILFFPQHIGSLTMNTSFSFCILLVMSRIRARFIFHNSHTKNTHHNGCSTWNKNFFKNGQKQPLRPISCIDLSPVNYGIFFRRRVSESWYNKIQLEGRRRKRSTPRTSVQWRMTQHTMDLHCQTTQLLKSK